MLLVATNKTDLATDYLIVRLQERQIPFRRLNTEDFGTQFEIDIALGEERGFSLRFKDGMRLTSASLSGVYFRQALAPAAPPETADSDREFARQEMKETLRSLWRVIDPALWMNHPKHLWLASNKIEQLSVARTLGFAIPDTMVTSSAERVKDFYEKHGGKIVCKAVKHGFIQQGAQVTIAPTKRVEPSFIARPQEYASIPMLYQQEIRKHCDVRVTVVGRAVYATAIYSQDHAETQVDWRTGDAAGIDLRHEPITLPDDIAHYCARLTAIFNLKYSAIDLVWGTEGTFTFLELNPNGQWAWIEQKAGYPIRDAIIASFHLPELAYAEH